MFTGYCWCLSNSLCMTLGFTGRIISPRPQLSLNALDFDGLHLDMQNYKHEVSVESECGSVQ